METALKEIIAALVEGTETIDAQWLERLLRRRNKAMRDSTRRVAKKRLLPYYFRTKAQDPATWESWHIDAATEQALIALLKAKPRRSASGVATITVLTKPHPCSGDCLYCPSDVRMPKSYMADEPACQRAERNFFDPYLQVRQRLRVLQDMGHVTDKVELIVLGGTWSDYPQCYQLWFVKELFRALSDAPCDVAADHRASGAPCDVVVERAAPDADSSHAFDDVVSRERFYRSCGLSCERDVLVQQTEEIQNAVDAARLSYNDAVESRYSSDAWEKAAYIQQADFAALEYEQKRNEDAAHRAVGLVIETRPDLIATDRLVFMRRLGCTKVQMGIQSLDDGILQLNRRRITTDQIASAFHLLRLFGFKIHIHFMVNLPGADPASDKADFRRLVEDERFLPDEVKLYPCCLVKHSHLYGIWRRGQWRPYTQEELVDVLTEDVLATPSYTRISRMIRDISAKDIIAGNKKTNLRQAVEARVGRRSQETGCAIREIRMREIATDEVKVEQFHFESLLYRTADTEERFLQWLTAEGKIAAFLRLSLPLPYPPRACVRHAFGSGCSDGVAAVAADMAEKTAAAEETEAAEAADTAGAIEAMIREVHVYGRVAPLHGAKDGLSGISGKESVAQHTGLGRRLVEEACRQALEAGYTAINVISSVGTRNYYRNLGFRDNGLYQRRPLA